MFILFLLCFKRRQGSTIENASGVRTHTGHLVQRRQMDAQVASPPEKARHVRRQSFGRMHMHATAANQQRDRTSCYAAVFARCLELQTPRVVLSSGCSSWCCVSCGTVVHAFLTALPSADRSLNGSSQFSMKDNRLPNILFWI